MPFKSAAQRRYLHAEKPAIAARFEAHTPKTRKLAERVRKGATGSRRLTHTDDQRHNNGRDDG